MATRNGSLTRLLTINTGSSSLKAALYHHDGAERLDLAAEMEEIGHPGGHMRIEDGHGTTLLDQEGHSADHGAALHTLLSWLQQHGYVKDLRAIGHRIVHGGSAYSEPQRVSDAVVEALRALVPIDPNHLPQAIEAIEIIGRTFPDLPQVACFDTAFHRHMPRVAQMYALPRRLEGVGVVRYGFHGLSYEFVMHELRRLDPDAVQGRVIIAHLGNGASMAAVKGGGAVDTTMGFTPTGGLVMGTRSGDLDPGVLLYLLESEGMSAADVNRLVNRQAGLLGVSGSDADMRVLLARESSDDRAAEAVALFCYQAKKFLGALAAVLGGLDTLIFTAGIGEHSAPIRERICDGLEFLGIRVDGHRNARHAAVISRDGSPVTVRVIPTDEDLMIARHTYGIISTQGERRVPV